MVVGRGISAGMSYTRQTVWGGDSFTLVGAGIGIPLPGGIYLNAAASKLMEAGKGWSARVNLIIPLDPQRTFSASGTRATNGAVTNVVNVSQALPAGPGWGWHVSASDSASQRLQAGAALNTSHAQLVVDANAGQGSSAVRIGANGSVGWMAGLPFAARRIDQGAFAVVNVGGFDQVPVYLSNQLVATTNASGLALVTGLVPYQQNQLTVNPAELPVDVEIRGVKESVVPYAHSGVFVDFPVRRSRNALVVLHQADGRPVPPGARARVGPDSQEFAVGKRGEVYLMDLQDDNHVAVQWKDGVCAVDVRLDPAGPGEARLGPLTCGETR